MLNSSQYGKFSVSDFICDEYFQDWILHPDEEKAAFWANWLMEHPEQEAAVNEARQLLSHISFRVDRPEASAAARALERAWPDIEAAENTTYRIKKTMRRLTSAWRMAAVWILVVATGFIIYKLASQSKTIEVATRYGQLDSLTLPDRSKVVLNANSSLSYDKDWQQNNPREVWLKGEALFNVQHLDFDNRITPAERFIVHVGGATIEVLGTSFNIRQRRKKIEIALLSGSIKVHFDRQAGSDIVMKPGELLVADSTSSRIQRTSFNTDNYVAWTRKRLVLSNPTLADVVAYLEDTYGKKIVLRNPALASRKVEGPILLDSLEDALFVLSTVLNVQITEEANVLIIK